MRSVCCGVTYTVGLPRSDGQPRTLSIVFTVESAHRQHVALTDRHEDGDEYQGGNADGDAVQGGHTDGDNDPDGKWCVV